jgi:hypothetical protein
MFVLACISCFCSYAVGIVTHYIASIVNEWTWAVPWLSRSPQRPGFDPWSFPVGFLVNKVALGESFPRVLGLTPVLHNLEKRKKLVIFIIFVTGLHSKAQGCRASIASAASPFATQKINGMNMERHTEGDRSTRSRPTSYPSAILSTKNPTLTF